MSPTVRSGPSRSHLRAEVVTRRRSARTRPRRLSRAAQLDVLHQRDLGVAADRLEVGAAHEDRLIPGADAGSPGARVHEPGDHAEEGALVVEAHVEAAARHPGLGERRLDGLAPPRRAGACRRAGTAACRRPPPAPRDSSGAPGRGRSRGAGAPARAPPPPRSRRGCRRPPPRSPRPGSRARDPGGGARGSRPRSARE